MPLKIPYYKANGYAGPYTPDFLIKSRDGFWVIETKGAIFEELANLDLKAQAARMVRKGDGANGRVLIVCQNTSGRLRATVSLPPFQLFRKVAGA